MLALLKQIAALQPVQFTEKEKRYAANIIALWKKKEESFSIANWPASKNKFEIKLRNWCDAAQSIYIWHLILAEVWKHHTKKELNADSLLSLWLTLLSNDSFDKVTLNSLLNGLNKLIDHAQIFQIKPQEDWAITTLLAAISAKLNDLSATDEDQGIITKINLHLLTLEKIGSFEPFKKLTQLKKMCAQFVDDLGELFKVALHDKDLTAYVYYHPYLTNDLAAFFDLLKKQKEEEINIVESTNFFADKNDFFTNYRLIYEIALALCDEADKDGLNFSDKFKNFKKKFHTCYLPTLIEQSEKIRSNPLSDHIESFIKAAKIITTNNKNALWPSSLWTQAKNVVAVTSDPLRSLKVKMT